MKKKVPADDLKDFLTLPLFSTRYSEEGYFFDLIDIFKKG